MEGEPIDLSGYCARIGYSGSHEPTLALLRAIVAGHTAAIPFENLDVLAKRPIRLDRPSLCDKLVRHRRGGYCYEHNLLLLGVLRGSGFAVLDWPHECTGVDHPAWCRRAAICCCMLIWPRDRISLMSASVRR